MNHLTTGEIVQLVWDKIKQSPLSEVVNEMYRMNHPIVSKQLRLPKEFIVVSSLTNVVGDVQVATAIVNIYVRDVTPTIDRIEQRFPDVNRLSELSRIAFKSLKTYPKDARWFFDVSDESLISEEEIPYSFVSIKIKLKKY